MKLVLTKLTSITYTVEETWGIGPSANDILTYASVAVNDPEHALHFVGMIETGPVRYAVIIVDVEKAARWFRSKDLVLLRTGLFKASTGNSISEQVENHNRKLNEEVGVDNGIQIYESTDYTRSHFHRWR